MSYNPGLPRCEVISLWPLPVRNQEENLRRNLIPVRHDALLWDVPMPSEVVSWCCPPPGLQEGWVKIGNNGKVRYLVPTYWADPEFEQALCNTAQPLGSFLDQLQPEGSGYVSIPGAGMYLHLLGHPIEEQPFRNITLRRQNQGTVCLNTRLLSAFKQAGNERHH